MCSHLSLDALTVRKTVSERRWMDIVVYENLAMLDFAGPAWFG